MFARFTPGAKHAIFLAADEAGRLRHPWLGTEHVLLGLLRQSDTRAKSVLSRLGVTKKSVEQALIEELGEPSPEQPLGLADEQALREFGIDLQEVRRRVESVFGPGALDRAIPGRCGLPMMPRAKQSIEHAARAAGREPIDTDHLLVGITRVRGALAMTLLQRLGVSGEMIQATVEAQRRRAG